MWVPYGVMWVTMGRCESLWGDVGPYGAMWVLWGNVGALWGDVGPYGESLQGDVGLMGQWESLWVPMGPIGFGGPYGVS